MIAAHYMPTALSSCCKIYKSFSFLIRPCAAVRRSRRSFHCRYCNNTFQSDVSEAEYVFPHLVPCFMNIKLLYLLPVCLSRRPFCSVCVRVSVSPLLFCLNSFLFFAFLFFSLRCCIIPQFCATPLGPICGNSTWRKTRQMVAETGGS